MASEGDIRIGTEDRERALEALSTHLTAGRIELGEYDVRCAAATAARTRAEVLGLFSDLPEPHPVFDDGDLVEPEPLPPVRREDSLVSKADRGKRANTALGLFLGFALTAVVVVTAITGAWWVLIPAVIIGLVLLLLS